jgi:hypothetical protein
LAFVEKKIWKNVQELHKRTTDTLKRYIQERKGRGKVSFSGGMNLLNWLMIVFGKLGVFLRSVNYLLAI